jgi:uncharacterized phage infection (PIP) family protein YhgE
MSEKLKVEIEAEISQLQTKLKEAQDALLKFGQETESKIKPITLKSLTDELQALTKQFQNVEIGTQEFKSLQQQIEATQAKLNSATGGFTKINSGFNGLSNSINQVTREFPAFAFSAQTGFLALSNNIPILVDNITQLTAKNKELAASGEPTKSVFQQVTSALFSWQSAMSLGIALITIYGKEIAEFFSNLANGTKTLKSAQVEIEAFNNALESGKLSTAIQEVIRLQASVQNAKKGFEDGNNVIKKYNETIGITTRQAKTLADVEKGLADNTKTYISNMIKKVQVDMLAAKAKDLIIEKEQQYQKIAKLTNDLVTSTGAMTFVNEQALKNAVKELSVFDKNIQTTISSMLKLADTIGKEVEPELKKAFKDVNASITPQAEEMVKMEGSKQQQEIAKALFDIYKNGKLTLDEIGNAYVTNPFFRDMVDGKIATETQKTYEAFNKLAIVKLPDVSNMGFPKDEEIEALNANVQNFVNILGSGLTSAFNAALISGENFGQIMIKMIGDMIKKLLAAVAVASILSGIMSVLGIPASTLGGGGGGIFAKLINGLTGFNFGGKPTGNKVLSSVPQRTNEGAVSFEIRGDKLYGVLQNYNQRLNLLA